MTSRISTFCLVFLLGLPVQAQEAPDPSQAFEAARQAVSDTMAGQEWVRTALGRSDGSGVRVRFLDGPDRAIATAFSSDGSRGGVLIGRSARNSPLAPGLYTVEGRESPVVRFEGREIRMVEIPDWALRIPAHTAILGDIDWMCEGFPDNGSPGLNFCETFVACAQYDLFCGGL